MRLTVLVGCYGGWPEYSIRAVESLLSHCIARERLDVFVGCNECSAEILTVFREYLDGGRIEGLVECRRNINKDPMMRVLLELCETEYVVWLDDDSHVLPGWDVKLMRGVRGMWGRSGSGSRCGLRRAVFSWRGWRGCGSMISRTGRW